MAIKKPSPTKGKHVASPSLSTKVPESDYPVFCLRYMDASFDILNCDKDEQAAFAGQMRRLSQMTWQEIILSGRHGLGSEKISRKSISRNPPAWVTDDVDFFLALRFQGKKPFVGHRRNQVFHVFWVDSKFSLYNH